MQKGADGVWSVTLTMEPEVYRYAFLVDGLRALDLYNPDIRARGTTPWSYLTVPGTPRRSTKCTTCLTASSSPASTACRARAR